MAALNLVKLPLLNLGLLSPPPEDSPPLSYLQYEPVEKENFLRLCQQHKTFPILYKIEYKLASKPADLSSEAGRWEDNRKKNRNQNVIPYDCNRVILEADGDELSDYINASHIDGLVTDTNYIVTQGPLEETVADFWRMVWQQKVSCIIMLTKCFDFTKKMCTQYWPIHENEQHGSVFVQLEKVEALANYELRYLKIWHKSSGEADVREVVHAYYKEWPCYANAFIPALLDFRRRIRGVAAQKGLSTGKTVVHCSDGAGRSGVYLAVDANIELLDSLKPMADVFGYLRKIKAARKGLVENEDQLKFVYDTLEEYLHCGETSFPVQDLPKQIQRKFDAKFSELRKEYELVCRLTPKYTVGDCAGSYRMENRWKNRDITVIAPDNFRPYLTSYQGQLDTDFINAVFVDTYKESKSCIITEWPLASTVSFFWSLIYDYNVSSIVVLSAPENAKEFPAFWPDEITTETYGPVFTVTQISHTHVDHIRTWIFEVHKKIISLTELMTGVKAEPKRCQLFQLTNWPMGDKVPSTPSSIVDLMLMVERWRLRAGGGPTVILSHDGKSRVGIVSAAFMCVEQVRQHNEVDVFTSVRILRRPRPRLMPNLTEYRYCYEVVLHYVLHCLRQLGKAKEVQQR